MKKTLLILLALSLLLLSGCSCDHRWTEADCLSPKICAECGEIEGEALGHRWKEASCTQAKTCESCGETEGEALGHHWQEADCLTPKTCTVCAETEGEALGHEPSEMNKELDPISCMLSREQHCQRCDTSLTEETVQVDSLIEDELFLFTPLQFTERMSAIAEANNDPFTYQITDSETGLMVEVQAGESEAVLQFFYTDTSPFTYEDRNSRKVWCTSLIFLDGADADLQYYYLMAVDPTLDKERAFQTHLIVFTAYANATREGTAFGYHEQNVILFEYSYLHDDLTGWGYTLEMTNAYASDFRPGQ